MTYGSRGARQLILVLVLAPGIPAAAAAPLSAAAHVRGGAPAAFGPPAGRRVGVDDGQARRSAPAVESARLARAKDLISNEQWLEAIPLLRAAAADRKEPSRDEALFWLAHSQNEAGHLAESVESVRRLQREFGSSRWARPAHSLLIELAQKLGRSDFLWWTAAPPAPPAPPAQPVPAPAPRPSGPRAVRPAELPPPPPAPPPPGPWFTGEVSFDPDLRVQALGSLMQIDAEKAIPMLASIALEQDNPGAARRAVFVLAQSRKPEAHTIVADVARRGAGPVRVAAVRELGRFGGPEIARELVQLYGTAEAPVKRQVLTALGERQDAGALLRIVQSETDRQLRHAALITLGRAGGREPLRTLYARARIETRRAIIEGLFNARDEEGLIRIARQEKDEGLRTDVLSRLRLLGTPGAKAFLETAPK